MQDTSQGVPSTEKTGPGWDPGGMMARLASVLAGGGRRKKLSGRTNNPPAERLAQHHLARWRDEGRQALVIQAIRLGVIDASRPAVGPRFGPAAGQFRSWKTLAVAVERARRAA